MSFASNNRIRIERSSEKEFKTLLDQIEKEAGLFLRSADQGGLFDLLLKNETTGEDGHKVVPFLTRSRERHQGSE